MKLATFFKRKYRYAPIEYIGRKQVQQILGAKITKFKKLRDPNETLESPGQNP
jgi:hypothetical protein